MGDICRMHDANRTAAVYEQDTTFLDDLRRYVGATIQSVALSVNDPIGSISAAFNVRMLNGEVETLAGPLLAEVSESGVLGFELQEQYEEDELRRLLAAAIADSDNGLDDRDRDAMRAELDELPNYYGG
jgi:hypothetical protein